MTVEEYLKKRNVTEQELMDMDLDQMFQISRFSNTRKRKPLTYEQRLKISVAKLKKNFAKRHQL